MMEFEALDLSVDIQDKDYDNINDINLKWNLELEAREWGLKSIIASIPDFKCILSGNFNDKDFEIEIDSKDFQVICNIDNDKIPMYPNRAIFNLTKKTIEVE